jgi:SAM-dependent methyltransferase
MGEEWAGQPGWSTCGSLLPSASRCIQEIAGWLASGRGSRVLDAGCGTGGMTAQPAKVVGPAGRVVAVDGVPAAVAATSSLVAEHGLADRVEVVVGELPDAPAGAGPFDLIWVSRVVQDLADEAAGSTRPLQCPTRPAQQLASPCRHPLQGDAMHPTTPGIGRNR